MQNGLPEFAMGLIDTAQGLWDQDIGGKVLVVAAVGSVVGVSVLAVKAIADASYNGHIKSKLVHNMEAIAGLKSDDYSVEADRKNINVYVPVASGDNHRLVVRHQRIEQDGDQADCWLESAHDRQQFMVIPMKINDATVPVVSSSTETEWTKLWGPIAPEYTALAKRIRKAAQKTYPTQRL